MERREIMGLIGLGIASAGANAATNARERFIGVWKLISYENKPDNGDVFQVYGPNPIGRITYDKAGRMSATLMRPGRKAPANPRSATVEELREVQSGFVAYFGTYDVDEQSKTVIHHVEAALNPNWPGTDLRRSYEFSENRLTLRAQQPNGVVTLAWQREPD